MRHGRVGDYVTRQSRGLWDTAEYGIMRHGRVADYGTRQSRDYGTWHSKGLWGGKEEEVGYKV